jgi:hypothetical protein
VTPTRHKPSRTSAANPALTTDQRQSLRSHAVADFAGTLLQGLPRTEDLNFFAYSDDFMMSRLESIQKVQVLIAHAARGQAGPKVSKRYNEGLELMLPEQLEPLNQFLIKYVAGLQDDCANHT